MKISEVVQFLEGYAPPVLKEDYDNVGLLVGDEQAECTGILCTLDVTEDVIAEAIHKKCNMVVAHHPLIFRGLKRLTGANETERVVAAAIRQNISVFASHTNLDNLSNGVNDMIAKKLGLKQCEVLEPRSGVLYKLHTFVPQPQLDAVRDALFAAGAGNISRYTECSFTHPGKGTFKPGAGTSPFSGTEGTRSVEDEIKLEVILPAFARSAVLKALFSSHPYEEVAYDLVQLANEHQGIGSGLIGTLDEISEQDFLKRLLVFNPAIIRHSPFTGRKITRVAVCGGAGSFLVASALRKGAQAFVTADLKYHEFFGAEGRMLLCDIGHFESEQFTTDLFVEVLERNFPNFAVLKSEVRTNPVHYFTGK
jgi:dinuclear metal center YbgI/SA1388 family protein